MARHKKDAPRPDTVLVTFRLGRSLVAALDRYADDQGLPTRSDAARDLMKRALASTAVPREPAPGTADPRVLDMVRILAQGPGGTLRLATLRARLADIQRSNLDQALRRLDAAGEICLGRAVDLATLTLDDREAAVRDELRGMLIYVSIAGGKP